MEKSSFVVTCGKCGSKKIFICGDTTFNVQIECKDCGNHGVEDDDLVINGEDYC